ncbi:hypothetical protein K505DRAFT_37132 [Melanomma pulvis-pyrius CBS 109.77]|uniref:Uncharacterized protein n=1 Tax=Melanomma pulvis-pyrius CBS 109.77 TaxID=1314802 RepID=A0A6A6XBQ0_9PLEO|nr:hypothetical protein K505DRAFT_37132 [Melanomma pulvis-pyrius CBS 109.77]
MKSGERKAISCCYTSLRRFLLAGSFMLSCIRRPISLFGELAPKAWLCDPKAS